MLDGKSFLVIIPARGGSKRLPRKNILPLGAKPLIAWSIDAAKESRYADTVLVSSDDDEILSVAKEHNAKTIKRPAELATDTATSFDAIKHAIEHEAPHDFVILLQPTSPFRTAMQIDEAIELLSAKGADAVISVSKAIHSPLWSNTLPENMSMEGFLRDELLNKRSQDLPQFYSLNGSIYICATDKLLQNGGFFLKENIFAYEMEPSVDIDSEQDFKFAQFLLQG